MKHVLLSVALTLCFVAIVFGEGKDHRYSDGNEVPLYVNKIGPYSNPSETYNYYSLPFCSPRDTSAQRKVSFGEALEGAAISSSLYKLPFKVQIPFKELCSVSLNKTLIDKFKKAIEEYYYFELLYDDIPVRGFIGTMNRESDTSKRFFLFKHLVFTVLYNGDRVIYANVTADLRQVQELKNEGDLIVDFSFSARWAETTVGFDDRVQLLTDNFFSAGELEIHWLSIMNSFVLVILLTGFIAIIIFRVLRSDYSRYNRAEEEEEGDQEDYGWKLVHGDVFRFPPYKMLFCSFVGNGAQFLCLTFFLLILAVIGIFYPGSDANMRSAAVAIYGLTAGIAGYVSSSFYKKMGGEQWAWNIILTTTLFAVPFFIVAGVVNLFAGYHLTTTEIKASVVFLVLVYWLLVGFPLTVIGGIAGKRLASNFDAPVRTKIVPREIPPIPWYRRALMQMVMAGFLPFSAIYIELYYIYASVWGHAHYTLYGILFLVFIILIIVTACITIALTYFQLSMEDYRWWWRSFLSGGSTGFFIYAYSVFYFFYRSRMSGSLQGAFFFGHMASVCYFFFIMLGTVGFYSSLVFIRHIYKNLKCD
eukprot:TRINITY_DN42_c0_g1_i2.p1 TRINITY_DN42_c0_g1~~TRINITY_DN42_c0_g1_i2.p1  ORF type:complete len:588 (-),score=97.88 TRINITY_DN42_c0_g1_i2:153-1916(-)